MKPYPRVGEVWEKRHQQHVTRFKIKSVEVACLSGFEPARYAVVEVIETTCKQRQHCKRVSLKMFSRPSYSKVSE